MLWSVLVLLAVVGSQAAPHGPAKIEHIHYDQQQHAQGNNLRLNMNKILVAILPLEDALSGLGLGGSFGGSSGDYDDHFTELTLEDLKPPPPPTSSEPQVEDVEPTAEVIPSSEATEESNKDGALATAYSGTKAAGVAGTSCTRGDLAAGRCKRQRRPDSNKLTGLLIPLLQRFQQQNQD